MLDPARAVLPLHPTFFFLPYVPGKLLSLLSHPRDEEDDDHHMSAHSHTHTCTHTHIRAYTYTLFFFFSPLHNIHDHAHTYNV